MPATAAVLFVGGMLDGRVKQIPTTIDDTGPLPSNGYNHGRRIRHVYRLAGWRPNPGVWVYALTKEGYRRSSTCESVAVVPP